MTTLCDNIHKLKGELFPFNAVLVAVSKTKPLQLIQEAFECGQRIFGENYVQELVEKQKVLPAEIEWHFIGHLQSNKVKFIAPFVKLIHGVDSFNLLNEINKEAKKNNRKIDVLLQIYIAKEETKFGLSFIEADELVQNPKLKSLENICIKGFMGMASNTNDLNIVAEEFKSLKSFFEKYRNTPTANCQFEFLSMGMSGDYQLALTHGSNMVRIGSLIFGERL